MSGEARGAICYAAGMATVIVSVSLYGRWLRRQHLRQMREMNEAWQAALEGREEALRVWMN